MDREMDFHGRVVNDIDGGATEYIIGRWSWRKRFWASAGRYAGPN